MQMDKGPWQAKVWPASVNETYQVVVQSDDFTHDAALIINGDFASKGEKLEYAKQLASLLNKALSN